MKEKKGISLIVLVVTIIVMIIISGAIIITLTQTNIIDQAEEATFKSQVRTIEEALNLKKASLLISNRGDISEYNLTLASLGLDPSLESQFSSKLYIDGNGNLLYQEGNVSAKEEQWLNQLEINGGSGISIATDFVTDVLAIYSKYRTTGYNSTRDYHTMLNEINALYSDTVVFAINEEGCPAPKDLFYDSIKFAYREEALIKYLEDEYGESDDLSSAIKEEAKNKLGYNETSAINIKSLVDEQLNVDTVGALIDNLESYLDENKATLNSGIKFVLVNGEHQMYIDDTSAIDYAWQTSKVIFLNATESAQYTYEELGGKAAKITGYSGARKVVKVPGVLTTSTGDLLFVTTIAEGAFANTKPMRMELTSTVLEKAAQINMNKSYDSLTMAESKAFVNEMGGDSSGNYTDDRAGKNKLFLTNFIPMFKASADVTEANAVEYVGEGNEQLVYGVVKILDKQFTPQIFKLTDEHVDSIDNMIISQGITTIEQSVIPGNYIGELYLPSTIKSADEDAFLNANIGKIRSNIPWSTIMQFDNNAVAGVFGSDCRQANYLPAT